jgi:Secretion system C-terminal sorting domain
MKKFLIALCWLLLHQSGFAQNITKLEYFFDNDPGTGKGTVISITADDTLNITRNISAANLPAGMHILYIRARNINGWSHATSQPFIVEKATKALTGAEYFFDNDPGKGKAISLAIDSVSDTVNIIRQVPVGALTEGFHVLYIRFKDSSGNYSLAEKASFYVTAYADTMSKILAAEYFIDTDPGVGKGKKLAVTEPVDTLKKKYNIVLGAALSSGQHFLGVRVKNEDGQWSLFTADTFNVSPSAGFAAMQQAAIKDDLKLTSERLVVYPNPAKDVVHVALKNSSAQLNITILDLKGSKIRSVISSGNKLSRLNISDLAAGTYILQIDDGEKMESVKFIKQ